MTDLIRQIATVLGVILMATSDLCRRVWGKVSAARPHGPDWEMTDWGSIVSTLDHGTFYIPKDAALYIRDACVRWLLANVAAMDTAKDGEAYFVDIYRRDGEWTISIANLSGPDLTTCLLLAVERCHEYKENK